MTYHLQAGESGEPVMYFSLNLKTWEPGALISAGKRRWMFQLKQREQIGTSSTFLFYSDPQALDDAYTHWWGPSSLPSLPIQLLISPADLRLPEERAWLAFYLIFHLTLILCTLWTLSHLIVLKKAMNSIYSLHSNGIYNWISPGSAV